MNQEGLERILSCEQLPTLPAIALRVIELTSNVNVLMDELAQTIQNDQGLSAKVLKTVNSSFYGLRRPCSTINQALVMLGLSAVKSLSLSFSLVQSVGASKASGFDFTAYWRRGLYTGVAAKLVAHRAGLATEDEAFLGGLLQDVGMVAMLLGLGPAYQEVLQATGPDHRALVKNELAALELQHPDVGALLAQRWKLPDELLACVRYHERPTAAPVEHLSLVRCVALGNLAHDVLTEPDPSGALRRFYDRAREWHGIDASDADAILKSAAQSSKELSTLFSLNTGAATDAQALLDRAKTQSESLQSSAVAKVEATRSMNRLVNDEEDQDVLTGALSRLAGLRTMEELFDGARPTGRSLSLLAVAIDRLPTIVEQHGTAGGDVALAEVAGLLTDHAQPLGAAVARWDAGSFVVMVPGFDRVEAVRLASEIKNGAEAAGKGWKLRQGPALNVSVSVGVATLEGGAASPFVKVQQLLSAAVRASEAASAAGGNAVRAFAPRAHLAA